MKLSVSDCIKKDIESDAGFYIGISLLDDELLRIQEMITHSWIRCIAESASTEIAKKFEEVGIQRYHELCHLLDHSSIWSKRRRILSLDCVGNIRNMSLIKTLEGEFGRFLISDEEDIGHEEIYWRLVRPDQPSDVGPLHADAWFWELGQMPMPADYYRIKVWTAIHCDPGLNGFRYVPGSHRHSWSYYGQEMNGVTKPQIDISEDQLNIQPFISRPGDTIIFHDRLLHGGLRGSGNTRVSIEFTIFVPQHRYFT